MTENPRSFSFGKNWQQFVSKHLTEERVRIAKQHILDFLEISDLKGKSFLDVGCGSGLSSLAAWEAGAEQVVSFDLDPGSVKTTECIWQLRGAPANWVILRGSVLDTQFLSSIEPADIVYAWGVLHHTGRMWQALRNAATLLKKDSLFYIALYVTTSKSGYWLQIKKKYNRASGFGKHIIEGHYILRHVLLPKLVRFQNPIRHIRTYKEGRGMEFMTDVRDWLGGYPFEDAKIEEVLRFCNRNLHLNLVNLTPSPGFAEYLFHKPE